MKCISSRVRNQSSLSCRLVYRNPVSPARPDTQSRTPGSPVRYAPRVNQPYAEGHSGGRYVGQGG